MATFGIRDIATARGIGERTSRVSTDVVLVETENNEPGYMSMALLQPVTLDHGHTLSEITDAGALAALNTVGTAQIAANAVTTAQLDDLGVAGTYALGGGGSITLGADGRVTAMVASSAAAEDASISGTISGSVADGTYILDLKAPFAYTINSFAAKLNSGTLNAKIQIEGVDVTGITALAVSSSEDFDDASGANSVSAGQTVTLVTSAQSSADTLSFTLKATRA